MAAAGYAIRSFQVEELNELLKVLQDLKSCLVRPEKLSAAVFPIFPHEAKLTEATLDLMVLFFDHILLYIDTFNFEENERDRVIDKLNAYIENEFVSIFGWESQVYSPISLRVPHVYCSLNDKQYPWPIHEYIERTANLITSDCFRRRAVFLGRDPIEYEYRFHLFNRLHGFFILCELLNVSGLSNPQMKSIARESFRASPREKTLERATFGLIEWYGNEILKVPSFARPEVLIKLRNDIAPNSFVNVIIDVYDCNELNDLHPARLVEDVKSAINRQINLGRRVSSHYYPLKRALLTGLIATGGGFLGGTTGAILGGLAAEVIPQALELLDRKRVAPWSAFFLD